MTSLLKIIAAVIVCLLLLPGWAMAQKNDEAAIKLLLSKQEKDWNRGDIDSYMQGYWNNDSLVFIGKNGPRYGYKNTLLSYKKGYPDTIAMGKLNFELLQLKKLSPAYYFVTGKWNLKRRIGDLQGYFTLLFKKIKSKWVIVSDHSS